MSHDEAPSAGARVRKSLGAGSVFEATLVLVEGADPLVEKRLRTSLSNDAEAKLCLVREAKVLSQLNHPRVPRLRGVGSDKHGPYVLESFVAGCSLREVLLAWTPEPPRELMRHLARRVLSLIEELQAATDEAGPIALVHGDISPDDLRMTPHGDVALVDFGLARSSGLAEQERSLSRGGTLPYLAPELCRGEQPPDQASDRYAACLVAAELVSARPIGPRGEEAMMLSRIGDHGHIIEGLAELGVPIATAFRNQLQAEPGARPTSLAPLLLALSNEPH